MISRRSMRVVAKTIEFLRTSATVYAYLYRRQLPDHMEFSGMKITFQSAHEQLAKVGIALAVSSDSSCGKRFLVTTPVGSEVPMRSSQVLRLVKDLNKLAVPA